MNELITAFGIDWKLIVAQGINFFIVFGGLTFFLYKPLLRILADREDAIAQGVKDAESAKHAYARIEEEKTGIIGNAEKEAEGIVVRAQEVGKKERADIVKQAQMRAEATLKDADAQAKELRRQALLESEQDIARSAILAAEKILRSTSTVKN